MLLQAYSSPFPIAEHYAMRRQRCFRMARYTPE